MKPVRFHFIYTLRYIKYGLALSLIPMFRLLFQLDFDNFLRALWQDLFILLAMAALSIVMWWVSACRWEQGALQTKRGFLLRVERKYEAQKIAAVEIDRPLYCRILGASIVTVYFTARLAPRKQTVYLSKANAIDMVEHLLPACEPQTAVYKPTGMQRWSFALLSVNLLSTLLIYFFGVRQLLRMLGDIDIFRRWVLPGIVGFERWLELYLPAGAAILATLLMLGALVAFSRSLLLTARYKVERRGGLLLAKSGLITHTERRIRLSAVSQCDVRLTPLSRLLRLRPVYLSAGGYRGGDLPILLCKGPEDAAIGHLIPCYHTVHPRSLNNRVCKSFAVYIWLPAALFCLFALIFLVASGVMPDIMPLLSIPCLLCMGSVLVHTEGYFYEGLARLESTFGIRAVYTRFFTRHEIRLITEDIALSVQDTPVGFLQGRTTVKIQTPPGNTIRIRGVGRYLARNIPLANQRN